MTAEAPPHPTPPPSHFLVWREFVWGALAGAFGEGVMHPVDTLKTRVQSQALFTNSQAQKNIFQMVRTVHAADGRRGFYRGITPAITGSLATGATYFGVIESTKKWIEKNHSNLSSHWVHFIAGGVGDTVGSFIYVPCEVLKQRMQVQGSRKSWASALPRDDAPQKAVRHVYCYYSGMFQAGYLIWRESGLRGLYAGYWSTLARDVPFAGLMVTFYEALKKGIESRNSTWFPMSIQISKSCEGLLLGGVAGGFAAYLTTPLDVIKTRLQVQGSTMRYTGWLDVIKWTWEAEGMRGLFKGSVPRIIWYVPASSLTFMAVEFLREHFNNASDGVVNEITHISLEASNSKFEEAA